MKKTFISLAIICMAFNANAQWFLGGNVGLSATVMETKKTSNPYLELNTKGKNYLVGFIVAPRTGYYFNDKLALGLDLLVGADFAKASTIVEGHILPVDATLLNWRVAPFLRFNVFKHKNFALALEGSIGVGGRHNEYKKSDLMLFPERLNVNIIGVGIINLVPVLTYNFNDRLQFEAGLNFLNLGYNLDIIKAEQGANKETTLLHDFNIGFNSKSVFVVSQLTVGVIYKFK